MDYGTYHYPPDLFSLLSNVIPLLCRSKQDVFIFLKGCGVPDRYMKEMFENFQLDRNSVNKYQITKHALEAVNRGGDRDLAIRREIIKRVVEFEDFSTCWPDDQPKAKGYVSDIRHVLNVKDSFTRIKLEKERELDEHRRKEEARIAIVRKRRGDLAKVKDTLFSLFHGQTAKRGVWN